MALQKQHSKKSINDCNSHHDGNLNINFCTDFDNSLVTQFFMSLGMKKVSNNENWHIYWSSTLTCRQLFQGDKARLTDTQFINHFPTHAELVRKDLLAKNIIRYRKELEKHCNPLAEKVEYELPSGKINSRYLYLDIIPTTFILPKDYNMFVEQYRKYPQTTWILKPCGKSQGAGIYLINNISKLQKWPNNLKRMMPQSIASRDNYVISRYISNPLLIGGKKFDLRIYVLVTSFYPLKAYMFLKGFCRFCTMKYDTSVTELDNIYIHLTNVSVQKHGVGYNKYHGGKLGLHQLRLYLEGTRGYRVTEKLFENIQWLIVHSLKAVANVMTVDRHCFECYGYDIIIDDNLKPWLIEVNASPSMTGTTNNDRILKWQLIDNILSVVLPPDGIPNVHWDKNPTKEALGDFVELVNEEDLCKSEKKTKRKC